MQGAIDVYFPHGKVVTQELNDVPDHRSLELIIGDKYLSSITMYMKKGYKGLRKGQFEAYCTRGCKVIDETTDDDVEVHNDVWAKSGFAGATEGYVGRIMVLYGDAEFMQKVREIIDSEDNGNVDFDSSDDDEW